MKPFLCISLLLLTGAIAGRQVAHASFSTPAIAASRPLANPSNSRTSAPAIADQTNFTPLPPPRPNQIAPRGSRPKTDPATGLPTCSELAGAQAYDRPLLFTEQSQLGSKTPVTPACVHPVIKRGTGGLSATGTSITLYGFQMENRQELLQTAAQLKDQSRLWYSPGMYREELRRIQQLRKTRV